MSAMGLWNRLHRVIGRTVLYVTLFGLICAAGSVAAAERSMVEDYVVGFVRALYGGRHDVQVKVANLPASAREAVSVKNISFTKMPDGNGDGVCLVDLETKRGRNHSLYVPFKALAKKRLYMARVNLKKGDTIGIKDVAVTETFLAGNNSLYPAGDEEIVGKRLKRDLQTGGVFTNALLDDPIFVQRGDVVTIVADNRRLTVHAKGRTLEKGRIGDTIRVKNITSGREVVGRLTAQNTVTVEF